MAKEYTKDELAEWFRTKASTAAAGPARRMLFNADERGTDRGVVGNLYFYRYHAKGDGVLPLWDKYPMALILEMKNDGFLGLNLHYLPQGQRATLLYVFNKYKEKYQMRRGVITGGAGNWENLLDYAGTKQLEQLPKKALKKYLYNQVRSKLIKINPDEYDKAIQLPIEEWVIKR